MFMIKKFVVYFKLCGYQGLSLCHLDDFAEITESLAKNCRIGSFKEVLINTNCTP